LKLFFEALLEQHESWQHRPIVERAGDGWRGLALTVPPPPEADLVCPLDIELVSNEVTISFDCSHIHMQWPPERVDAAGDIWFDALAMIDAILGERVLSSSGWIDGKQRVGSLHQIGEPARLLVRNLQHLRVRSWKGTFNRDERLPKSD
jgi:hypothetical protein